ncbi:MAG: alpha/beta hydrolase fold domain-containing protein [Ktedonobacterales bacterium]
MTARAGHGGATDPLRDEGKAYANRLHPAGNVVTDVCYPGMPHG